MNLLTHDPVQVIGLFVSTLHLEQEFRIDLVEFAQRHEAVHSFHNRDLVPALLPDGLPGTFDGLGKLPMLLVNAFQCPYPLGLLFRDARPYRIQQAVRGLAGLSVHLRPRDVVLQDIFAHAPYVAHELRARQEVGLRVHPALQSRVGLLCIRLAVDGGPELLHGGIPIRVRLCFRLRESLENQIMAFAILLLHAREVLERVRESALQLIQALPQDVELPPMRLKSGVGWFCLECLQPLLVIHEACAVRAVDGEPILLHQDEVLLQNLAPCGHEDLLYVVFGGHQARIQRIPCRLQVCDADELLHEGLAFCFVV
mmetsp:Transcript_60287/g.168385  ORF Transcript_60287/g.168385 Transcript_60287/m.168385 type:complete len:313 (-) Transcript_60287:274-1212(-)